MKNSKGTAILALFISSFFLGCISTQAYTPKDAREGVQELIGGKPNLIYVSQGAQDAVVYWADILGIPESIDWFGKELNVSTLRTEWLYVTNKTVIKNVTVTDELYVENITTLAGGSGDLRIFPENKLYLGDDFTTSAVIKGLVLGGTIHKTGSASSNIAYSIGSYNAINPIGGLAVYTQGEVSVANSLAYGIPFRIIKLGSSGSLVDNLGTLMTAGHVAPDGSGYINTLSLLTNDASNTLGLLSIDGTNLPSGQVLHITNNANIPAIVVTDATQVNTNLNADLVDGFHMNQNLLTSSSPTFNNININGDITMTHNDWIGLSAGAGRMVFYDGAPNQLRVYSATIRASDTGAHLLGPITFTNGAIAGVTSINLISDIAYAGTWNGVTTTAPSKNAVYDQIEADSTQTWTAVSFLNSWVDYDAVTAFATSYTKDHAGFVHLRGLIKDGTVPANIFQLPVGSRPSRQVTLPVAHTASGATGRIYVMATGHVYIGAGHNGWVSLDGLVFHADS